MNKELLTNYLDYNTYDYMIIGNALIENGYNLFAIAEYNSSNKPSYYFLQVKDNIIYNTNNEIVYKENI